MRLWGPPKSAAGWGSYICLACGLSMILFTGYLVWSYRSPLLWWDQWVFLRDLLGNHGHYSFSLLWKQQNDHRIVIPKLLFLADLYIFHGTNAFLLLVTFSVQLANLACMAALYAKIGKLSPAAWRTAVGLTAICLFSPRQMDNFLFGSGSSMVLPYLAATVAFSSLGMFSLTTSQTKRGQLRFLVLCWGSVVMAALTFSSGLFLWPMLVVLGIVWRLPRRWVVATAALGVAMIAVMIAGTTNSILESSSFSIPALLKFLVLLYGSSWSFVSEPLGIALASIAVPATSVFCLWVFAKRRTDTFAVILISLIGFVMANSVAIALGRIVLGIDYARTGRYQAGILLFWCCLAALLIRRASRSRRSQGWLVAQQAVIVLIMLFAARMAKPVEAGLRIHADNVKWAAAAIDAGVMDTPKILYPLSAPFNRDLIVYGNFLRSRHWSIFAESQPFPLGRRFDRYYRTVASSACAGAIDSVDGIPDKLWPGFRITGWAWDLAAHMPGRAIVLTDSSGRLIGAARTGIYRPDVPAAVPSFDRNDTGYVVYVPADLQSPSAEVFVILSDNISACRLSAAPLQLPLASTAYSGPAPTGVTRNMVRYRPLAAVHIDALNGRSADTMPQPFAIHRYEPLKIEGWALDPMHRAGVAADISVDGVPCAIQYGIGRPDLVTAFGRTDASRSGFVATLPALAPGPHSIALRVVSRDEEVFTRVNR